MVSSRNASYRRTRSSSASRAHDEPRPPFMGGYDRRPTRAQSRRASLLKKPVSRRTGRGALHFPLRPLWPCRRRRANGARAAERNSELRSRHQAWQAPPAVPARRVAVRRLRLALSPGHYRGNAQARSRAPRGGAMRPELLTLLRRFKRRRPALTPGSCSSAPPRA